MSKILLKAETHQGTIELPMTQKKALAFAKKLLANHKKERANIIGGYNEASWRRRRYIGPNYAYANNKDMVQPFIKVEFIHIDDEKDRCKVETHAE